jgi:hypothetical protein
MSLFENPTIEVDMRSEGGREARTWGSIPFEVDEACAIPAGVLKNTGARMEILVC